MAFDIGSFYRINNKKSGKSFDIQAQSTANDALVVQNTWYDRDSQKFIVYPLNDGNYAVINKKSGKILDIRAQSTANDTPVVQNTWYGRDSQKFFTHPQESGFFSVQSKLSGKVFDIRAQSTASDAVVIQNTWYDRDSQKFSFSPVESISVPSIQTYPRPDLPQYDYLGQELPDYVNSVVTNYTLAPSIAVEDPWYNDQQKIQTGNAYYLYVREQYWLKVTDTTLAPGTTHRYMQTSGIKETDITTVQKTVSHTFGADVGLSFKKDSVSAGMSYQYSEELMIQETKVNEELSVVEKELAITNNNNYSVSWTQYILVNKFYIKRADGSIVNEPWIVTDTNTTHAVYYPSTAALGLLEGQVSIETSNAEKAVYNLFADAKHSTLKIDTTDYMIDQAALQVEQLSDEEYALEKMMLLNLVRCAKQVSKKRNLLHYGDFESPNWRNPEDGWKASYNVSVLSGSSTFKGNYLNMPGATARNGNITPTYVYQKVDESKLKPYTRYVVRGFVGSSKELELFVTRYGKEILTKMNIPTSPLNTYNQTDSIPNNYSLGYGSGYTMSNDPCQLYPTNPMPSSNGLCEEKQNFVFHIDVGEINQRADLGIGVGFKISSPSGMAQLDNIEVIEANPLTGEALARVKKREKKWKRELEQQCALTEKTVSVAQQAVNHLFTDAQKNRLKATTTMQDIRKAEEKVKAIPFVYNLYFEEVPGMNYTIFQALQSDVYTASRLYNQRNIIRNGDFSSRLSSWHATEGADVQERDGRPHVLVISQWDTNVSQDVCVQPERGYVLRVTARKEGSGKGYVTISDCTAENTETVTFTANEDVTSPRPPVRPRQSVTPPVCDSMPRYAESFGIVPDDTNMMNRSQASYGTASCSCGCGKTIRNGAESCQTNPCPSTPSMPIGNGPSSDYITKTIEIFPETNRVRIEIGETEGSFLVESVELICMEE
ncbi:RICIN domain-containing protein [Bacillus mycoides]|uniref:RICIN domain-containing protein n=1 Tax=Bacillus mycoides TaxID=1405 RepID=UPI00273C9F47|nr:RICIN domain-containing protein [Bacillus mycoides]